MASYDLTGDDYVIERTEDGQTIYHMLEQAQDDETPPLAVAMAVATEVAPIHATVAPDARSNNRRRGRAAEEDSDTDYDSDAPLRQRFRFVAPPSIENQARMTLQRFVEANRGPNYAATPGPTLDHTMALADSDTEEDEFEIRDTMQPTHGLTAFDMVSAMMHSGRVAPAA